MKRSVESTPDLQGMGRPMVVERSMLRREAVRNHRRSAPSAPWRMRQHARSAALIRLIWRRRGGKTHEYLGYFCGRKSAAFAKVPMVQNADGCEPPPAEA